MRTSVRMKLFSLFQYERASITWPTTTVRLPATSSSRPMRRSVVALAGTARLAAMATAMAPHNTLLTRCIQDPLGKTQLSQEKDSLCQDEPVLLEWVRAAPKA